MYTLTILEGTMLALGVLVTAMLPVLGVVCAFPRALRTVGASVYCPLLSRNVVAELDRDEWTLRRVGVRYCSVLGQRGLATCNKRCLAMLDPRQAWDIDEDTATSSVLARIKASGTPAEVRSIKLTALASGMGPCRPNGAGSPQGTGLSAF
jgi:hypothetical protein